MEDSPTASTGARFERLVAMMARLRAPGGCPWDRKQTFESIKPYTLEETYEVFEALDAGDWPAVAEELGDLLLQCVFYAQMASEQGHFSIDDSLAAINRKLVRRHPHVFGGTRADTAEQVKERWDEIKHEEYADTKRRLLLDGVPRTQPALAEAAQISSKVAAIGFDWETADHVLDKLHEELAELAHARAASLPADELEGEIGDILFVIVNIARHLKIDPEQALRKTNRKFRRRFAHVEESLKSRGTPLKEASLEEMEALWQEAKREP